ncbi:DUF2634 domain-containing protein [Paenibacillus sp. YYML68]|uniref:DUF2634 domain-containing protein n=1 Tax=Paenibacillus sp. YYML68 TaxID=2909250 RepID=UPI0024913E42|nr:DUF2634 domain-containing protein [Paenibacillus sp. YYML68]
MIPQGGTLAQLPLADPAARPSRTYALDFESGRISGMIDHLEAVRQAVFKILNTDRYAHAIYSTNYGHELHAGLVGADPGLFRSELMRQLREALLQDDRISAVENIELMGHGDEVTVTFTVISTYGSFTMTKGGEGGV